MLGTLLTGVFHMTKSLQKYINVPKIMETATTLDYKMVASSFDNLTEKTL